MTTHQALTARSSSPDAIIVDTSSEVISIHDSSESGSPDPPPQPAKRQIGEINFLEEGETLDLYYTDDKMIRVSKVCTLF